MGIFSNPTGPKRPGSVVRGAKILVRFARTLGLAQVSMAVCVSLASIAAAADLGVGRVDGAAALNVRQGPGANHPSIGMLHRGDTVRVETIVGKWALVHTADLTGYVHSAFVAIDVGAGPSVPTATPIPADGSESGARDGAAAPSGGVAAPPRPTAPVARLLPETRQELQRVLALTEELQRDLEELRRVPTPAPRAEASIGVQSGIGLLGLGGVIGFFVGTILVRRQERGNRSRVRF